MENLFWLVSISSFIVWAIAVALNASEDALQFHYKESVFSSFKESSWPHWYFKPTKYTWKRKYKNVETLERKKFLGITIPAPFFDGWHGLKAVRFFFTWLTFMLCVISGTMWVKYHIYTAETDALFSWWGIAGSLIAFWTITITTHNLFLHNILMKKS